MSVTHEIFLCIDESEHVHDRRMKMMEAVRIFWDHVVGCCKQQYRVRILTTRRRDVISLPLQYHQTLELHPSGRRDTQRLLLRAGKMCASLALHSGGQGIVVALMGGESEVGEKCEELVQLKTDLDDRVHWLHLSPDATPELLACGFLESECVTYSEHRVAMAAEVAAKATVADIQSMGKQSLPVLKSYRRDLVRAQTWDQSYS